MMKLMASFLGAKVIGYDGDYFLHGFGNQYTAYSDGSIKLTKKESSVKELMNSFTQAYNLGPMIGP